jgi:adenosine deaminase
MADIIDIFSRMRDLAALPKAHLHIHLEGGMRPATLTELAAHCGIEVPATRGFGSFSAFAGMYVAACGVLRQPDDVARLVTETVEDAADAGATWVEPAFYLPRYQGLFGSTAAVLEAVIDAGQKASAATGVGVGWMVSADRTVDPAEAVELAQLAVTWAGRGVVSFGLANDEDGWPPAPFAHAFALAKAGGLLATPHAGELAGAHSVRSALDDLNADRIQHGVRAVEDPELVRRLADEGVCLDVCPTSNVLLNVVPSLDAHPLPALLDAGVRCSLNGDDPLLFGPGLLEEYNLCREQLGLDDAALAGIAKASLEASGAPVALKRAGTAGVDAWLAA